MKMNINTFKKIKTFIILNTICLSVYGQNLPTKYIEFYQNLETETYENKFKILDKAIEKNPKEPWYYWMYANVYVQKNDEKKALYYYEKALIIDSNFSEGHASLARFLYNVDSKNLEKALSHINVAIKAEPNTSYYYIDRAEIYLKLKKYELAIKDANFELTIVDSDPNTAYQIIVKALYEQNKKNELFDLLRKYDLSQNPMSGTDFGILLGDIYYEMGEKEKACNCFRAVAEPYEMMGEKLPEEIDKKIKACK